MTGTRELRHPSAMPAAPEQVRVSVVGGRTQLDVALPVDIPVASLLPELVKLVRSRDVEATSDTPWSAPPDTFWVLSRLNPPAQLRPEDTLRDTGIRDGELLALTDEHALSAPTLYDDVVDAAAQLNKAAYAGWHAAAATRMSFAGLAVASLAWVQLVVDAGTGAQRALVVGLAAVLAATLAGAATLAHRSYRRADVAAALGWCAIPIIAAIGWAFAPGFPPYGAAGGCALMVVLNAAYYRVIGTGRWGYLASSVVFAAGGCAMLGHALGTRTQTVGVVWAVTGALGCLTVPRLTDRLRVETVTSRSARPDTQAVKTGAAIADQPSATDSGAPTASTASRTAMPTAEAVWARVRAAAATRSALYAGLAVGVVCGATAVLRAGPQMQWTALAFAAVCATALGVYARVPDSVTERVSLGVPAATLMVVGALSAQRGTTAMAWAGLGTLLAAAAVAAATGLMICAGSRPRRWSTAWAYLQYAAYAALIPVALWATGVYARLGIR